MDDYINREDAIRAVIADAKLKNLLTGNCENEKAIEGMVYEVLCPRDVPSADVVEVVRCKDCKHRHDSLLNGSPFEDFCDVFPAYIGKDDYCSYGERAEDEDEEELRAFVKKILLQKREEMTSMINKREDDYIKRKDAIEKFAGVTLIECDKTTAEGPYSLSAAERFFADIPSADVVPKSLYKQTHWERDFAEKRADDMSKLIRNKDVVAVVRCKDCKHKEREQPGMVYCPMMVGSWVADDHFCKWGERRERADT